MKLLLPILILIAVACSSTQPSMSKLGEDELFITRKYVGDYLEYRHTGRENFAGPNIIWIKTTMDSTYGKFSAYGKKCRFNPGDRLYLKRIYTTPGIMGYWTYQIENDSSLYYEVLNYQSDKDYLVQDLY